MRHFKKGLVTFVATAAVLAPAALAGASTQSASTPAKAPSSSGCSALVCVYDIYIGDVLSYNNIPVDVAANVCNTNVAILSGMVVGAQGAACAITQTTTATIFRVG